MEVTLQIPDDVASEIQNGSTTSLARRLLELAAIKAYEANIIDEWGVIEMLGLTGREDLYDAAPLPYRNRSHPRSGSGLVPCLQTLI